MKKNIFLTLCWLLAFSLTSVFAETNCNVTLSPELNVHIPALQFNDSIYSADFQHERSGDGSMWFRLVNSEDAAHIQCKNPVIASPVSENYFLFLPSVFVGIDNYWATLKHIPEIEAGQAKTEAASKKGPKFILVAAGRKGSQAPNYSRVPDKLKFASKMKIKLGEEYSAHSSGHLEVSITVKSEVRLGAPLFGIAQPLGVLFGESSGSLEVIDSSCQWIMQPELSSMCATSTAAGSFEIRDLTISKVDSPTPAITMTYGITSPQINILSTMCYQNDCFPVAEIDLSDFFVTGYGLLHSSEDEGSGTFVAEGWSFREGGGGVGWPYAFKNYPKQIIVENAVLTWEDLTSMSLVE
jgi:hypothetical protein